MFPKGDMTNEALEGGGGAPVSHIQRAFNYFEKNPLSLK